MTTPHETKVGITEDDQLAEIYLERENEYTLAGSIYKGRVTRVLPGMQSAFVDIGLERDAFLYVSDFMDLEQQDEDLDEAIPANRPAESRPRNGIEAGVQAVDSSSNGQLAGTESEEETSAPSSDASGNAVGNAAGGSRDFRGRRRRRGRRGERPERSEGRNEVRTETRTEAPGEIQSEPRIQPRSASEGRGEARTDNRHDRFSRGDRGRGGSDSRFQRSTPPAARATGDYDYGPPPGYQPIILPGESISKYQRQGQPAFSRVEPAAEEPTLEPTSTTLPSAAVTSSFPEDEPIFATEVAEPLHEQHEHESHAHIDEPVYEEHVRSSASTSAPEVAEFRRETQFVSESYSVPDATGHETEFVESSRL